MSDSGRSPGLRESFWIQVGMSILAVAFLIPLCRRGIILSDEGYILQQSLDLLQGKVLYRDLDSFVMPGVWFVLAGLFSILEPGVLASRAAILLADLATLIVVYQLVARLADRRYAVSAMAVWLALSVWAFPAWTFTFYSPFAILFTLWALERLFAWHGSGRLRDLFWVGIFYGLAICFKQNYGVLGLLGGFTGFVAMKLNSRAAPADSDKGIAKELAITALGVFVAGSPFLLYLLYHSALPDAWQSLVVHPFEFSGKHGIEYARFITLFESDLYTTGVERLTYLSYAMLHAPPIAFLHFLQITDRLHVLLYWLPPLFILIGLGIVFFGNRDDIAAPDTDSNVQVVSQNRSRGRLDIPLLALLCGCGFVFLGVFPRADFNHLVNVYQPVIVIMTVVVHRVHGRLRGKPPWPRHAFNSVLALLLIAYGGVAFHWYRSLLTQLNWPIDQAVQSRGGVLVNRMEAGSINHQLRRILGNTSEGDFMLSVPDVTMMNFLADRGVPSAYYNLYEHHISHDLGQAVVDGAQAHGVDVVLTRHDNFFSDRVGLLDYAPKLSNYIITHFKRMHVSANEEFIFYKRRVEPLVQHPFVNVLAHCEDGGEQSDLRNHLLFSSLYHRWTRNAPLTIEGVRTRCVIDVPAEGGTLSFELGYRRPYSTEKGALLLPKLTVLDQGEEQVLLNLKVRVQRREGRMVQQPYKRFGFDLAAYSGRRIELVFETRLKGKIQTHPLDLKHFFMVWRDPRLQSEAGGARP